MLYLRLDEQYISLLAYDQHKLALAQQGVKAIPLEHRMQRLGVGMRVNLRDIRAAHADFVEQQPTEVLLTASASLIPLALFDENTFAKWHNYVTKSKFETSAAYRYFYDALPCANAMLVYSLSQDVCTALEEEFGELHYRSAFTALLQHFSQLNKIHNEKRLYLHCREGKMDAAIFESHKLLYFNTYEVLSPSDVAYYAFSLAKILGIDTHELPIQLCGHAMLCQDARKELEAFSERITQRHLVAEYNRHPLTQVQHLPYDLATLILSQ